MTHDEAIQDNLGKASERLAEILGSHPTDVVQTHMAVANVFMLGALVAAVRELTETVKAAQPPQRERTGKAEFR